jgi:L-rhamnose mutarotase
MRRVGMTWRVAPEHWEEYRQIHLNPWPELITAIQQAGIHNYNIFAFGTRLFAYMEFDGDDLDAALAVLSKTDVKQRWDAEATISTPRWRLWSKPRSRSSGTPR